MAFPRHPPHKKVLLYERNVKYLISFHTFVYYFKLYNF